MTKIGSEKQAADYVRTARESCTPFEILAAGTKRGFGRPLTASEVLDVSGLRGILKYEPEELILTAAPGTPIAEIEAVLASKRQRLGFAPPEWAGLFGAGRASCHGVAKSADVSSTMARLRAKWVRGSRISS